jgi:hypothetical protein
VVGFPTRWSRIAMTLAAVAGALAVLACRRVAASRPPAPAVTTPSSRSVRPEPVVPAGVLTTAEKAAVAEFVQSHPDLRPATDGDRQIPRDGDGDVHHLYGVYHPYFVRGDVNDDGILDFVIAFVHRQPGRGTPWFSVVVFTGRGGDQGFNPGTFLERDISLARGDLSIDRDAILITPDLSDDGAVRRYRWDPVRGSYVFVRDDDDDSESPVLSQT